MMNGTENKKNQQAKDYIMEIIRSSPAGTKLPSERELMDHLNFSRPTVQHAIDDLVLAGYIYKVQRKGAFTANTNHCTNLNRISSFVETAQELGVTASTEIIEQSIIPANDYIARKMQCAVGGPIHFYVRRRSHANTPVVIDYSYFADFAVSNIKLRDVTRSVYQYIEQVKRLTIGSSDTTIGAVLPEPEIAALLKISATEPLILTERYTRLTDGRTFEYTISYTISKYNKFAVTSVRRG